MRVYFSGGSAIPETHLKLPTVMLSYYNNVSQKSGKVDNRSKKLIAVREVTKAIKGEKCPKKKKKGK